MDARHLCVLSDSGSFPPDERGDVEGFDCLRRIAMVLSAQSGLSDPLLADPCDDGVDITDDGGLGEPAVAKASDRG